MKNQQSYILFRLRNKLDSKNKNTLNNVGNLAISIDVDDN
ncbi:hypothetical protein EMIT0180MI3_70129 [Priestia megaterium]